MSDSSPIRDVAAVVELGGRAVDEIRIMASTPNIGRVSADMCYWIIVWVSVSIPTLACAADPPDSRLDGEMAEDLKLLTALSEQFDWDVESSRIEGILDKTWRRQGWTSEADLYAYDVAREISAIPPWKPMERVSALTARIAKRYELSEENAMSFDGVLTQEAAMILGRHAKVLLALAYEWMDTRTKGRPFSPDQVARWAKASEPLLKEIEQTSNRLQRQLKPLVKPSRRSVFDRDLEAFRRRSRVVEAMNARWAEGKWTAADWGMEDDPIQSGKALNAARPEPPQSQRWTNDATAQPVAIAKAIPHVPSTWFAYVRDFKRRYDLDPGQSSAAESILTELVGRAQDYSDGRSQALARIPEAERASHDAYEPIRDLFRELRARLDPIPTSSQRERRRD